MEICENVSLNNFTTFRTGGPARFFTRIETMEDARGAIEFAREHRADFVVLGGGSNMLVRDEGFPGLVVKMEIGGIEFRNQGKNTLAVVGAGEDWDNFVGETVARNLSGLENLSLIPGTAGAAPIQNIGAYGREASETIEWVETFNTETSRKETLYGRECKFAYRNSIFKHPEGKKYVVVRVAFSLVKGGIPSIEYKDVKEELASRNARIPSLSDVRNAVIAIRSRKLPSVKEYGTAGSFFKNLVLSATELKELQGKIPDVPAYPFGGGFKIPAGWLLDHVCSVKGERKGNVGAWHNQALVVVNYGGATAKEILDYAEDLRARVRKKTGIELEYEVQVI